MSKGHGATMRAVLARLHDGEWHAVIELPYDPEVEYDAIDRAAEESYRRACKRLAAEGRVELVYRAMKTGHIRPLSEPHNMRKTDGYGRQRAQLVVRRVQLTDG